MPPSPHRHCFPGCKRLHGNVLDIDEDLDPDNLPAVVVDVVKKEIGEQAKVTKGQLEQKEDGEAYYDLKGEIDGKEFDLEITKDGTVKDKKIEGAAASPE